MLCRLRPPLLCVVVADMHPSYIESSVEQIVVGVFRLPSSDTPALCLKRQRSFQAVPVSSTPSLLPLSSCLAVNVNTQQRSHTSAGAHTSRQPCTHTARIFTLVRAQMKNVISSRAGKSPSGKGLNFLRGALLPLSFHPNPIPRSLLLPPPSPLSLLLFAPHQQKSSP